MSPAEFVVDWMTRATDTELERWLEEVAVQIATMQRFADQVRNEQARRRLTAWDAR